MCSSDQGNPSPSLLVRSIIHSRKLTYLFAFSTDMPFRCINTFIQKKGDKNILLLSNYFMIKK